MNLIKAGIRDTVDEWHIECRFADGQKFQAIIIDKTICNSEQLAEDILVLINEKYLTIVEEG